MPRRLVLPLTAVTALAIVGVLTGCAASDDSGSTPSPSKSASASATPDADPSEAATPSATPKPTGTPIALSCDQLLTPDDVYAFNPNYGVAPGYSPSGAPITTIADENGLTCAWSNQTSGEIIEVAVAQPHPTTLAGYRATAATASTAVPTYGTPPTLDGFFSSTGGAGTAQVFTDRYWLVARSTAFFEPGDATELVADALSHLP